MNFADLRLAEPILRSLKHEGYDNPTPIQAQAIPDILAGRAHQHANCSRGCGGR